MSQSRLPNVLVLAAALLLGAGPYVVRAASPAPEPVGRANVDMQQLFVASAARKAAEARVRQVGLALYNRFQETTRLQFLTDEEIQRYSDAANADRPTDAQKQSIETIRAAAAGRADEFQRLSTTKDADLTPQARARIQELAAMRAQAAQGFSALKRLYDQKLADAEAEQIRQAMVEVRAAVARVAKEKGVAEVFDTTALVVAPADLTDAAMERVKERSTR